MTATHRIDLISASGDIREHRTRPQDPSKTLCGVEVRASQPPSGNRTCARCERIQRQLDGKKEDGDAAL